MYILHCVDGRACIFLEDKVHEHIQKVQIKGSGNRIPLRTKLKVDELRQTMSPKLISQWLRDNLDDDYVELSTKKINDLMRNSSKKNNMSLAELERWCELKRCKSYNTIDEDKLFTIKRG